MRLSSWRHIPLLWAPACILAGCAIAVPRAGPDGETAYMTRSELSEYTEQVFRRHNRVLNRLMMAADDFERTEADFQSRLEAAEQAMLTACREINELAAAVRDGRPRERDLRRKIPAVVGACDRESRMVAALLDSAGAP